MKLTLNLRRMSLARDLTPILYNAMHHLTSNPLPPNLPNMLTQPETLFAPLWRSGFLSPAETLAFLTDFLDLPEPLDSLSEITSHELAYLSSLAPLFFEISLGHLLRTDPTRFLLEDPSALCATPGLPSQD